MIKFQGDATQDTNLPIPDGDYFLTVIESEEKTSKSQLPQIVMELAVAEGQYKNRTMPYYLTFIPAGNKGHGMVLHALHAFGFDHDGEIEVSAPEFKGRTVKAKVGSDEYKGRTKNVVKDFYILDDDQLDDQLAAALVADTGAKQPELPPSPPTPRAAVVVQKKKLPWA